MGFLHWLGPRPDGLKLRKFTFVACLVLGPDRLHGFRAIHHDAEPGVEGRAVILHLLGIPARTDAEIQAAIGDQIQRRRGLRRNDGIALGEQYDAGSQAQPFGRRGRRRQPYEGIQSVGVLPRQLRPSRPGRSPAGGNMRVLGHEQRCVTAFLQSAGELDDAD